MSDVFAYNVEQIVRNIFLLVVITFYTFIAKRLPAIVGLPNNFDNAICFIIMSNRIWNSSTTLSYTAYTCLAMKPLVLLACFYVNDILYPDLRSLLSMDHSSNARGIIINS